MSLLGMAGVAASGPMADWGLLCLGLFLTVATALFGLLLRSKSATAASAVIATLTTFAFRPWEAFWPEPSDNWEAQEFQADFLFLARIWVIGVIGATTAVIDAYQRHTNRPGVDGATV